MRHAWLIAVGEDADRAGIMAVWMQLPFALLEIGERHTGVVLEQRTRMGEQEIANVREASPVQQIRRALHERIATAEALAKSRQPALPEAIVRDVCAEIIERVLATVLIGEHDLGPVGGAGGNVRSVACLDRAALGEPDERDVADRFARASEECIKHRQCAAQASRYELVAHLLGYEEAVGHERAERASEPMQR